MPTLAALLDSPAHASSRVVSQPDRPKGRGQQRARRRRRRAWRSTHGIPVLQPARLKDEAFLDAVRALDADLGVVAAYGRILPDALLAIPRLGMINVHASLLPR